MTDLLNFYNFIGFYNPIDNRYVSDIECPSLEEWCKACCWESCEQCPYAKKPFDVSDNNDSITHSIKITC